MTYVTNLENAIITACPHEARMEEMRAFYETLDARRNVLTEQIRKLIADRDALDEDILTALDEIEKLEAMTPDEDQRKALQCTAPLANAATRLQDRRKRRAVRQELRTKCRRIDDALADAQQLMEAIEMTENASQQTRHAREQPHNNSQQRSARTEDAKQRKSRTRSRRPQNRRQTRSSSIDSRREAKSKHATQRRRRHRRTRSSSIDSGRDANSKHETQRRRRRYMTIPYDMA